MYSLSIVSYNVNGIGNTSCKKRRRLFNYLHKLNADLILLQETHSVSRDESFWRSEWGGEIIFNHGESNARGVLILINRKRNIKIEQVYKDSRGRILIITFSICEKSYALANLYAPYEDNVGFFTSAFKEMDNFYTDFRIIAGDFNTILDTKWDIKGGKGCFNRKTSAFLNEFFVENDLMDIWRILHANQFRSTFNRLRPYPIHERLDYIIISGSLQQHVKTADILATNFSDHEPVQVIMTCSDNKPGRGYWKLNNSLLEDEKLCNEIIVTILEIFSTYDPQEICTSWDVMKMNIRQKIIKRGIEIKRGSDLKIKALEKKLKATKEDFDRLQQGLTDSIFRDHNQHIQALKSDLEELYNKRTEGAMLRCRANWLEFGEKPSKYYLSLEKRNYNKKTINKIINPENNVLVDSESEVFAVLNRYFGELYAHKDIDLDEDYLALIDLPQLSEKDKLDLEGPIRLDELNKVVNQLKKSKCPGLDGFTVEFYLKFWKLLHKPLHALFLKNVKNGILHNTARDGIISLLDKPDKNHLLIDNWRPLTLLNTDYKIYAKILANRLEKVLPYLISKDQCGFMKGRTIADNLNDLFALIDYCESNNSQALLLSMDMFKAFDSVSHEALEKMLIAYNFGPKFVDMIMICFKGLRAAVINNNKWDIWLNIQSGVKQGCNLSPKIFLLVMQLLNLKINQNNNIEGIKIDKMEKKQAYVRMTSGM